jgi:Rho-binding antiterminator
MLSCNHYDFVEIACMHHYPLEIELKDGEVVSGNALDTGINGCRQECIKIVVTGKSEPAFIVLDDIRILRVTKPNRHFQEVPFD